MLTAQTVRFSFRALQKTALWQSCRHFFGRHLLLVNTGTCTGLYMTGDLIQQNIEGCREIDWERTLRMAVLGMVMGPLNHGWYKVLDLAVKGAPCRAVVFKKVLTDQMVMAPMSICVFYAGMCTLEKRTWAYTKEELRTKSWPTYKTDWMFWPLAQTFNFYFVPCHFRVTYVNLATLLWTVYLSYMKHKWQAAEATPPTT